MRRMFSTPLGSKVPFSRADADSNLTRSSASAGDLRAEGDRARNDYDWETAERKYRAYLELRTTDAPIWIQLGHALKEQQKLADAEGAYRTAINLHPDDADGHLQLGHALKLQAKKAEAKAAYLKSYEIDQNKNAFYELSLFSDRDFLTGVQNKFDKTTLNKNLVYFEIDDLMGWMRAHRTLSGIQRVQVGIIGVLLKEMSQDRSADFAFVRTRNDTGTYWKIRADDVQEIIDYASGKSVTLEEQIRLLDRAELSAVQVTPSAGQCYFILGAFWGFNGDASKYSRLRRGGVSVGVYIYDLIPMSHPEFCDAHLVSDFALSLGDGLGFFNFVLTISESTAQEVRHLQRRLDLKPTPVQAVPLAHVLMEDEAVTPLSEWTDNIAILQNKKFVLSVSTIEARKNHSYLFQAWRLMVEEGLDPPDLVFVGRYGWRVTDFMEQLQATRYLNGRVHVLHDLSDAELEVLYENCQFTAFPSFVEGWGLPVGESLAHGKPCVASKTTSIPEVGGDLVDYIDPYNIRDGIDVLRRMSTDENYRSERERNIQEKFVARKWQEVGEDLLNRIEALRHSLEDEEVDPLLNEGELFFPSEVRLGQFVPANYPARPLRSILAESWYIPEAIGVWMKGDKGLLRFRTKLPPGTDIVVIFRLIGVSWAVGRFVEISIGKDAENLAGSRRQQIMDEYPPRVTPGQARRRIIDNFFPMRVRGTTSAAGVVSITINVFGDVDTKAIPASETRRLSVGLAGLSYSPRSDPDLVDQIADLLASS